MTGFRSDLFRNPTPMQVQPTPTGGRLAHRASMLALLVFVPLAPIFGLLTGMRAMGTAGEPRARAAFACLIAIIASAAQGLVGFRGYEYVRQIQTGPEYALTESASNGFASFRDKLQSRYGTVREVVLKESGFQPYLMLPNDARHYVIHCARGEVEAAVEFGIDVSLDEHFLQTRITRIQTLDEKRGDLTYSARSGDAHASVDPE